MGSIVVFDADVLIAHFNVDDAQHALGTERVRRSVEERAERLVSCVTYAELLVGPARIDADRVAAIQGALRLLGITPVPADASSSERAAELRAKSNLSLPDAYALATALAPRSDGTEVRLETFDKRLARAFEAAANVT